MGKSIDLLDKESIMPVTSPTEGKYDRVGSSSGSVAFSENRIFSLNGVWQMAESGFASERKDITKEWADAHPYTVPGSIHSSLVADGTIPDPYVGLNDQYAREESYKVWWVKKEFDYDFSFQSPLLCFDGVCYSAKFYLNGVYLGKHRGMFSKVIFDVKDILKKHNILIVKIDDAPALPRAYSDDADYDDGWKFGTVINCVYGWHYVCIPSRGIWAPVYLKEQDVIRREEPFITTIDAQTGEMDFSMLTDKFVSGNISMEIAPNNFEGDTSYYSYPFRSGEDGKIHFRFHIPDAKLWWPNGYGEQNLYQATVLFSPDNGSQSCYRYTIGVRTVRMVADAGGDSRTAYRWQMVINGRHIFMKGANWCTIDALLNFEDSKYERLLTLAKDQNLNLLRAWGCRMPESNTFYELCDRLGLMVMQEWPTAWDSDKTQPFDEMHDTVAESMIRLRNHPSLVMYAGGNESNEAKSAVMDDMIKLSYRLDGTRPFRRTSPYGDKVIHSYATYWYQKGIDASLQLDSTVLFEFGMASAPNVDSVKRYIPEAERGLWELRGKHNSFVHHTPRFNQYVDWPYGFNDIDHLTKYLGNFYDEASLEHFVTGTQLAQATIYRHPIDHFRSRYPYSTGISYYKLNDVYPAASWATVDYYGAPKMSHYAVKDAFRPLHACLTTQSVDVDHGTRLPLFLLNDNGEKTDCVRVNIYDNKLHLVDSMCYSTEGSTREVTRLGTVAFAKTDCAGPLFVTLDVLLCDRKLTSTFYWFNYKDIPGCLFQLPQTVLSLSMNDSGTVTVRNEGELPAVGVMLDRPDYNDSFYCSDGLFWLNAGETKELKVNSTHHLRLRAWNSQWE